MKKSPPVTAATRNASCLAVPCVAVSCLALTLLAGCAQPMVVETLYGDSVIYPNILQGKPTILTFLSANDRRCDEVIPSLWSLAKRPGAPVRVMGILTYDDFSYVKEIDTLTHATFPIILDPDKTLAREWAVDDDEYPTFVLVSWEGKEIERSESLADVPDWLDSPRVMGRAQRRKPVETPAD